MQNMQERGKFKKFKRRFKNLFPRKRKRSITRKGKKNERTKKKIKRK